MDCCNTKIRDREVASEHAERCSHILLSDSYVRWLDIPPS